MIQRLVNDPDAAVRAKAIVTLANMRNEDAANMARDLLADGSPRAAASAAVVLASTGRVEDARVAERTLADLASDTREEAAPVRRDVAAAIRQIDDARCRHTLIPLLQDPDSGVAEEAMRSVRALRPFDALFVPTLVSLLGDRRLKSGARDALVSVGEPVLDMLGHVLGDREEDIWVRRHVPATLARIPRQRSMDLLVAHLDDPDGFLRYKVVAAMNHLHRFEDVDRVQHAPLLRVGELLQQRFDRRQVGDLQAALVARRRPAGAGSGREDRPRRRPRLSPPGAALSMEGRRRRAVGDRARGRARGTADARRSSSCRQGPARSRAAPLAATRRGGNAAQPHQRRRRDRRGGRHRFRPRSTALEPGGRRRARAGAPRRQRLGRLRSCVVDVSGTTPSRSSASLGACWTWRPLPAIRHSSSTSTRRNIASRRRRSARRRPAAALATGRAARLVSAGGRPALHVLLDGSLRAQGRADESRTLTPPTLVGFEWALERAHPGDAVGLYETLAGTARGAVGRDPFRLVVEETGAALRIDREELFDLIGQRPALLQQLFAALIGVRHPSSGG